MPLPIELVICEQRIGQSRDVDHEKSGHIMTGGFPNVNMESKGENQLDGTLKQLMKSWKGLEKKDP